ncbi:hypothetical protein KP509_11G008900 [Ceratopteris richardii]|uniref:Membrane magnesium transporter n=1 Tax=Ceratopteris richardii TaxID=49495 RepID=A0A8T2TNW6_CERRI|nr:hypothetical protein KP509_11G008900 [Ceratopteris richardii]
MAVDLVVGLLGIAALGHAAFSTVQYRNILKVTEEAFLWPPFYVIIEICISLVLCFWAALRVPGQFLPVLPDLEEDRLAQLTENVDFMTFNHRGRIFPLKIDEGLNLND